MVTLSCDFGHSLYLRISSKWFPVHFSVSMRPLYKTIAFKSIRNLFGLETIEATHIIEREYGEGKIRSIKEDLISYFSQKKKMVMVLPQKQRRNLRTLSSHEIKRVNWHQNQITSKLDFLDSGSMGNNIWRFLSWMNGG